MFQSLPKTISQILCGSLFAQNIAVHILSGSLSKGKWLSQIELSPMREAEI